MQSISKEFLLFLVANRLIIDTQVPNHPLAENGPLEQGAHAGAALGTY